MTNEEILTDFSRRWNGTYVFLNKDGEDTLAHVDSITPDKDHLAILTLSTKKLGRFNMNFDSDEYELSFKYPPVGVFQHKTDAMIFQRKAERQYTRGIGPSNSSLRIVAGEWIGRAITFNLSSLESAFRGQTFNKTDAIKMLRTGDFRSVAMKDQLSISLSCNRDQKDFIIWHWDAPIARCSPDTGKVTRVYEAVYSSTLDSVFNGA